MAHVPYGYCDCFVCLGMCACVSVNLPIITKSATYLAYTGVQIHVHCTCMSKTRCHRVQLLYSGFMVFVVWLAENASKSLVSSFAGHRNDEASNDCTCNPWLTSSLLHVLICRQCVFSTSLIIVISPSMPATCTRSCSSFQSPSCVSQSLNRTHRQSNLKNARFSEIRHTHLQNSTFASECVWFAILS